MKLKLVVLAGAKEGLEIPLKKDKFLIGRSKECALRAGSEAISRRHCAIIRRDDAWTVRDLGSRNGTHVNGTRITEEVPLVAGDELRVGPLTFRVAEQVSKEKPTDTAAAPAKDSKSRKQPPVKSVADVVQRTISLSDSATEDDISKWLLDSGNADTLKETRSLKAEDTTIKRTLNSAEKATIEDVSDVSDEADVEESEAVENGTAEPEAGSGGWKGLFKRGKAAAPKKKQPGKLPPRVEEQSKDSREAAADILREMQRRR
jgi:pSer/pThr/pTyr-binding forkhead associated (FHA) protein